MIFIDVFFIDVPNTAITKEQIRFRTGNHKVYNGVLLEMVV